MRVLLVARNELAIVTKSIAFALSPATRSPWVPSRHAEGERRLGKHVRKGDITFRVLNIQLL